MIKPGKYYCVFDIDDHFDSVVFHILKIDDGYGFEFDITAVNFSSIFVDVVRQINDSTLLISFRAPKYTGGLIIAEICFDGDEATGYLKIPNYERVNIKSCTRI